MTSLRDIRKHIRSVQKTRKMMRAMKMISAQRLKRAVDALMGARPYADALRGVVGHLAAQLSPEEVERFPLMHRHGVPHRVMLVVMTSDRGLAGTFNSNVIRTAERFLWEEQSGGPPPASVTTERRRTRRFSEIQVVAIGRKGRDHFARQDVELVGDHAGLFEAFSFEAVRRVAESIEEQFIRDELHAVFIVYNEFKNLLVRNVVVEQFLPIVPAGHAVLAGPVVPRGEQVAHGAEVPSRALPLPSVYEPGVAPILDTLLPRHFSTQLHRAALESMAAEHAARMTAMEAATHNAGEMVDALTLKLNRARQAMITKELMEIIGGAEALK